MPHKRPPQRVTRCIPPRLRQPAPEGLSQRWIETDFSGGVITSNGGITLLGRVDERLDLTRRVPACFTDHRRPALVVHEVETLVLQRLYGLALGYEDLNDHEELRHDRAGTRNLVPQPRCRTVPVHRRSLVRSRPTAYAVKPLMPSRRSAPEMMRGVIAFNRWLGARLPVFRQIAPEDGGELPYTAHRLQS